MQMYHYQPAILNEIRSNSGKLAKEELIRIQAKNGNDDFFKAMYWVFYSQVTFGVKKVPIREGKDGPGLHFNTFEALADGLIERDFTGNNAQEQIASVMELATNEEWNNWYRLILVRDLDAGFGSSTINKAVKGINKAYEIPETPYMRCSLQPESNMKKWDWTKGVYVQLKADGSFANVGVNMYGDVHVTTRSGTPYPEGCLGIEETLGKNLKHGTMNHGEFVVYEDNVLLPREKGNGILNSLLKGGALEINQRVVFQAWDQIPMSSFTYKGSYKVPYSERFASLVEQVGFNCDIPGLEMIETRCVHSMEEALSFYKEVLARGMEGVILKSPETIWEDKTSKNQVKFKLEVDVDLVCIGFNPGEGKNAATFGSIIYQTSDGLLEVNVSGFTDKDRLAIHNAREEWLGSIGTVKSNAYTKPSVPGEKYSLYLPRFVERREDKTEADSLQRVIEQFEAAVAV